MFEFTKRFDVDDKLSFRLSSDPADESYTLLVKKVKDNLVAAVVSNNDKNRVNLNVGDEVYLFSAADGEKWITKTLLMQRQSYPLVILSVAEEPSPLAPQLKKETPAPEHEIELAENSADISSEGAQAVEAFTRKDEIAEDEGDELTSMAGITIRELRAEPDMPDETEGARAGTEDLDELPEIDTSELEAELDADIEDTLEKKRGQFEPSWMEAQATEDKPVAVDDSNLPAEDVELAGMVMTQDRSVELDGFDEEEYGAAPTVERPEASIEPEASVVPEEPEILDMAVAEPMAGVGLVEEESLYMPQEEDAGDVMPGAGEFHDFFTAYLVPMDGGDAPEIANISGQVPAEVGRVVESLAERIERLEKAYAAISGTPMESARPQHSRTAVVLGGLSENGFRAVMDESPVSGEVFMVEIERPWRPSLYLKAEAVAESSFEVNGVALTKFRFNGLDDGEIAAVRAYIDGRADFYRSLTELVKD